MHKSTWRQRWPLLTGTLFIILVIQLLRSENGVPYPDPEPLSSEEVQQWHTAMEERFQHRKQILEENCQSHKKLVIRNKTEPPYMHTAASLLTCPISKVGTTTWKTYMFRLIGQHPEKFQHLNLVNDTGHWIHKESKNVIDASKHYSDEELMSILRSEANPPVIHNGKPLFRLITVRPPLDRLVSAYKMFSEGFATEAEIEDLENGASEYEDPSYKNVKSRKKRRIYKEVNKNQVEEEKPVTDKKKENEQKKDKDNRKRKEEKELTMEHWISKSLRNTHNRHWKPYDTVCSPCFFKYDYILHLETFDEDLKYIYEKAGIQDKENTFNIKFHQTKRISNENDDHYFSSLPEQLLKNIFLKYRQDFYLFGYELPSYLKQFEYKVKTYDPNVEGYKDNFV